jgi:DNA polymerase-4
MAPTLSEDRIVHLDADAFFASVEQRDDPRLRRKPVAVGTGVVASCSYEARHHGVRTGMRLVEARQRCRSLIVIPGEYPRYEQTARRILAISEEHTPRVEVAALDDLYLDLTGHDRPERAARQLGTAIRDEVALSVSIGLGSNKMIARVATKQAKPGRQVCVPAGNEEAYLAPWETRVLPAVGPKTASRLDRLNVQHVGELAAMPVAVLGALFGAQGRIMHEQALGRDPRPVQPRKPQQSVSRCNSFDPPVADLSFLGAMLTYLLERACSWLRFQDLATRGLTLTIRYGDYETAVGRESFRRPITCEAVLKEAAHDRFARLYQRRLPLRFLGVELAPLVMPDRQPTLFPDPQAERRRRLFEVKDAIRHCFGFTSLLSGAVLALADRLPRDRDNFRMRTPCLTR